ncbi:MAG TPA: hypothetical protein VHE35_02945 [Kofleriaceae bacterium]|nr:hypothetical protein [Kofleriaceae bacterium]
MSTRRSARIGLAVVAAVALVLAVAATRAVWLGGEALRDGDAAAARGDRAAAISSWRTAARWYVPVVGSTAAALHRLAGVAQEAEAAGDPATALAAWQAIHTSIHSIEGLTSPFRGALREADAHLATLLAAAPGPKVGTPADREAWHAAVMAGAPRTSRWMLLLAALGLATWLAGGVELVRRGLRADGSLAPARFVRAAITIAAGAGVWLAAIALA